MEEGFRPLIVRWCGLKRGEVGNVGLTNDFAVPGPVHGVMQSTVNRERRRGIPGDHAVGSTQEHPDSHGIAPANRHSPPYRPSAEEVVSYAARQQCSWRRCRERG